MARKELKVDPREVLGKQVARLRRSGTVPANIYGHGLASIAVQLDAAAFQKTLRDTTANEVIDLKVGKERTSRPAVIHHVQRNPLTGDILHADFYQVSLREKIRTDVPIVLTGRSDAVSAYGGVLLQGIDTIHVEALPLDIPVHIEVDVSTLSELEASLHVRDLVLPQNVTVLTDPDVMVARVASPRVTAEEAAAAEAPAEAAPEEAAAPAPPAESKTPSA